MTQAKPEAQRLVAGRFRKKPVVIDAWAIDFNNTPYPEWVDEAFAKDETATGFIDWCPTGEGLYINTIEGHMQAKVGDYLIRGVAGELYACRADIFAATYEAEHIALASASAGGWVSVDERLPELDVSVALINVDELENTGGGPDMNVRACGYLSDAGYMKYWSIRGERATSLEAYTHWMPLPEAPNA